MLSMFDLFMMRLATVLLALVVLVVLNFMLFLSNVWCDYLASIEHGSVMSFEKCKEQDYVILGLLPPPRYFDATGYTRTSDSLHALMLTLYRLVFDMEGTCIENSQQFKTRYINVYGKRLNCVFEKLKKPSTLVFLARFIINTITEIFPYRVVCDVPVHDFNTTFTTDDNAKERWLKDAAFAASTMGCKYLFLHLYEDGSVLCYIFSGSYDPKHRCRLFSPLFGFVMTNSRPIYLCITHNINNFLDRKLFSKKITETASICFKT